jgi:predicted ester cyclase
VYHDGNGKELLMSLSRRTLCAGIAASFLIAPPRLDARGDDAAGVVTRFIDEVMNDDPRLRASFSDYVFTVDALIREGEQVAARLTFHGTHDGPFLVYAPTGARIENRCYAFFAVRDGAIAEQWILSDIPAVIAQIEAHR